jgi:hypothetical protein
MLRFSEVSHSVVKLREKPRKTLIHKLMAPTRFEPVFTIRHALLGAGSTGHSVKTCVHPVDRTRQATEPNSTSTGVGV